MLPNGIYKFYMRLYNDNDDNMLQMTVFFEKNFHFEETDFWWEKVVLLEVKFNELHFNLVFGVGLLKKEIN